MIKANAKEARQHFSHLMDQVENGEEVFILRRGHIIAHITPYVEFTTKSLPSLKEFRSSIKLTGKPISKMIIEARAEND